MISRFSFKRKVALALFGALLAAPSLLANVEVTASPHYEASEAAIGAFSGRGGDVRWFRLNEAASGRRDIGQCFFAPSDGAVNRLVLRIASLKEASSVGEAAPSAEFTIRFYEIDEGEGAQGVEQGTPIAAQAGHLPDELGAGDYLVFALEEVEFKANRTYAFVLTFDVPQQERYVNLQMASADVYPEGKAVEYTHNREAGGEKMSYSELRGGLQFQLLNLQ